MKIFKNMFKSRNNKLVSKYNKKAKEIIKNEELVKSLTNEEILNFIDKNKDNDINLLTAIREASYRALELKPFKVQLIGAMAMSEGNIAEMKTGEGKTLTAGIASVFNALKGRKVYVVTVNNYLARRDLEDNQKLFDFFNLSYGVIESGNDNTLKKKEAYSKNIVYGKDSEFGFDYLRDNMVQNIEDKVQIERDFIIVDEVDSILIDEARTPMIINGYSKDNDIDLNYIHTIATKLEKGYEEEIIESFRPTTKTHGDYVVSEKNNFLFITEEGITKIEKELEIENLYASNETIQYAHLIEKALTAINLYQIEVDYIVENGIIVLIDKNTGRLTRNRSLGNGLHQAIEAKEGVRVSEQTETIAEITYQNYFNLYKSLAGMTGTAQTEAKELEETYNLNVLTIPTNKPITRKDLKDKIFLTKRSKVKYLLEDIKRINDKGQPLLIGTTSVEENEELEIKIKEAGFKIEVLNAKNEEREAEIISNAGNKGSITLATNMAGRGVDIKVSEEVLKLGGLYVIGFERYENRRVDNQLRGRSGRQGNIGCSQFYVSLEDDFIRVHGEDNRMKKIAMRAGFTEDYNIESSLLTKGISKSQQAIENMAYEARKNLLKYDSVISLQRDIFFKRRDNVLSHDFNFKDKANEIKDWICDLIFINEGDYNLKDNPEIQEDFNKYVGFKIDNRETINKNEFEDLLNEIIWTKFEPLDNDNMKTIIRGFYLKSLDTHWRIHLNDIDLLKSGIGLRQMNQKDPVIEFKRESFEMFDSMLNKVKISILKDLIHTEFVFNKVEKEPEIIEVDLDNPIE